MKYYANLQVQSSCFIELRHDKTTHFYSAPYIHVGKKALVIFTRSNVSIYVDGMQVAYTGAVMSMDTHTSKSILRQTAGLSWSALLRIL